MRWASSASLLCLLAACVAQSWPDDAVNNTLWRRVRVPGGTGGNAPPSIDKLFILGPDGMAGGCSDKKATIESWLDEIRLVHQALEILYSKVMDQSPGLLWQGFFGIKFHINPTTRKKEIHPDSQARWAAIGDHISRVSSFLDGGGLREPVVPGEVPRLFCSEDAGEAVSWDSVVRDEHGTEVDTGEDPVTGQKQYVTVKDVYPRDAATPDTHAFWMESFKGYWIAGVKAGFPVSLCPPLGRSGATGRTKTPAIPGSNLRIAQVNRGIIICPKAFTRTPDQPHGQPSLASVIDNYPEGDKDKDLQLDRQAPMSMTLYHEIIHLTDYNSQTSKPDIYPMPIILKTMAWNTDPKWAAAVPHNPETYIYLGMAAYILQNPPDGKPAILYAGGPSSTESDYWDAIQRKRKAGP